MSERSIQCDRRDHESCDKTYRVMDQDGVQRLVCQCLCHREEATCQSCGRSIYRPNYAGQWKHDGTRRVECGVASPEPPPQPFVKLTDEQLVEVEAMVRSMAYKPGSRIEAWEGGEGFVLHTMEFPTPHSPPSWIRGGNEEADALGRIPMHWEFEDLSLRVAELLANHPQLTVRQATFITVRNVIYEEELHEIDEWISINGEHVLNPHADSETIEEWKLVVDTYSDIGLAR